MECCPAKTISKTLLRKVGTRYNSLTKRFIDTFPRNGGCGGKPRRLILRKVRRKLILNEREKLQQRRNELKNDIPTTEIKEVRESFIQPQKEDVIERVEENKNEAYEEAIAKLKSLGIYLKIRFLPSSINVFFQFRKSRPIKNMTG